MPVFWSDLYSWPTPSILIYYISYQNMDVLTEAAGSAYV